MTRLHQSYRRLPAETSVSLADVAAIAGVQRDTARRWAQQSGFPSSTGPGPDGSGEARVWPLGAILEWLCQTGRRDQGCRDDEFLTRPELCARFGLSEQTIKAYVWQAGLDEDDPRRRQSGPPFPTPDARRLRSPLWRVSTIERWIAAGGRTDRRLKSPTTETSTTP